MSSDQASSGGWFAQSLGALWALLITILVAGATAAVLLVSIIAAQYFYPGWLSGLLFLLSLVFVGAAALTIAWRKLPRSPRH